MPASHSEPLGRRTFWPLWCALIAYLAVLLFQAAYITRIQHDAQIYSLDDPYIHAAVAKNLVMHHIYGSTSYHFSFPCSSIIWPFVLAGAFEILGVHAWMPFLLNAVLSVAYLAVVFFFVRNYAANLAPKYIALLLLLLVFTMPLLLMTFIGMEHILHALAFLCLLGTFASIADPKPPRVSVALFLFSALFITTVRYEGLFPVFIICIMLLMRGRWLLSIAAGLAAGAAPLLFGIFSIRHGSTFLPPPLLLKTSGSNQSKLLNLPHAFISMHSIGGGILLVFVILAALFLLIRFHYKAWPQPLTDWLIIVLGCFLFQGQFARFGWLYRYEAYLVATGCILIFASISWLRSADDTARLHSQQNSANREKQFRWYVVAGTPILLCAGLLPRMVLPLRLTFTQAHAVSNQQYQTALFLGRFYSGKSIGLLDIGAPNFYNNIDSLDLWGLGSSEVERLKQQGHFDRQAVIEMARENHLVAAVLYPDPSMANVVPLDWVPVASWKLTDLGSHSTLGSNTITFYAIAAGEAPLLAAHLAEFRPALPRSVEVIPIPIPQSANRMSRGNQPQTYAGAGNPQ